MIEIRAFTVSALDTNCYVVWREGSSRALVVDPGDEAPLIHSAVEQNGLTVEAMLLTHTHFDHVGAVAALARLTGAPVYCPRGEAVLLSNIDERLGGRFGPLEPYDADHLVDGGDRLQLAGLEIEVLFTPGHSIGHVAFWLPDEAAVFSGDVLFKGAIGPTQMEGADAPTLMRTLAELLERLPDETRVLPGHMEVTTIGHERATNPFLRDLT